MCGIYGYIGKRQVNNTIYNGLRNLEYRGYDSAGIAYMCDDKIDVIKNSGKVSELEEYFSKYNSNCNLGIGHTRWATHGKPTKINAHPHLSNSGKISIVHNGIIENYSILKKWLINKGFIFHSDTDTEVLCNLIEFYYTYSIVEAVRRALKDVKGTYGIAVIASDEPDKIICARLSSPLIIGIGEEENFISSDLNTLIPFTKKLLNLNDYEICIVTQNNTVLQDINNNNLKRIFENSEIEELEIEKNGFEHYMLKEIHEQPKSIAKAYRGRINFEEATAKFGIFDDNLEKLRDYKRIILTACGTSWHAALVGGYVIEELAGIPVKVEYASELRYKRLLIDKHDIVIALSQSGETADTIAAIKEAKQKGAYVLGICNVIGSTLSRITEGGIYLHAGPEIGVASTKAFTSQLVVLLLVSILFGRQRSLGYLEGKEILNEIENLPQKVQKVLEESNNIKIIAKKYFNSSNSIYLGRGFNFPIALEGALKLKEISYIHAEGYPAAEIKHGPLALIDANMPVVVIANKNDTYDKIVSNILEIKARNGKVIAIVDEHDNEIEKIVDDVIRVPFTMPACSPILNTIPLQLLAYYIALERGCNVDQPKNLAKSVTVE